MAAVAVLAIVLYRPQAPVHIENSTTRVETKSEAEPDKKPAIKAQAAKQKKPVVAERVVKHPIGCSHYTKLVSEYSWNVSVALAVMGAESRCNPLAVGDGHLTYWQNGIKYGMSCGLFQVRFLPGRPDCKQMQDPVKNIAKAYQLYASGGWGHWSVCNKGVVSCF